MTRVALIRLMLRMSVAAIASLVLCDASVANCRYDPFEFFPDRNRGAEVPLDVENTSFCSHRFVEGAGYHFTSVKVELTPAHGKLEQRGDANFVFMPAPGFIGKDPYGFKICATKAGKSGCSSLRFDATVAASTARGCGEGLLEQVIAACTLVIDKVPGDKSERFRALVDRGLAFFRANDLDRALEDTSAALALKTDNPIALNNRGQIHQHRKELDLAIADFDKAIAADPGAYAAYANRSIAFRLKGDFARALADAERCVDLAPKFAGGYMARGLAHDKLGKEDLVLPDLSKAVELAPDYIEAHAVRAMHLLATGDFSGAARDDDAVLKADPADVAALVRRGVALMEQGDFDRAVFNFDQALKLSPAAAGIHINRGFAHFGAGDFDAAAVDFRYWAVAKPDHPFAALWLYLAQARVGKAGAPPLVASSARDWPAPVLDYLAGKATRAQLDADARAADDICGAAFYAGEKALIDKHPDEVAREIRQALEICHGPLLERAGALGEAARLNVSAGSENEQACRCCPCLPAGDPRGLDFCPRGNRRARALQAGESRDGQGPAVLAAARRESHRRGTAAILFRARFSLPNEGRFHHPERCCGRLRPYGGWVDVRHVLKIQLRHGLGPVVAAEGDGDDGTIL